MAKHIITAALPYANGDLHIGHLLEYIQADIYARFLKLLGNDALYICASDMHGTPIEVNAKKAGLPPEEFVTKFFQEHQEIFKSFLINFDNFYKTHSPENKELAEYFFTRLREQELIYLKEIEQMYDEKEERFLPDRFVKGECPKCGAEDQYGDNCEKCGAHYNPTELKNPFSTLSKTTPVLKKSKHYFFKLSQFSDKLQEWVKTANLQDQIKNWLQNWIKEGLQDWCISRDKPYFGFEIPNSEEEAGAIKYFYVWLDAPIGYISSTKNFTENWKDYWYKGKVHHFIGKDIVYFHYLFWIAMFMGMGIPLPEITTHGFITINGKKMSKSRGTFFTAKEIKEMYEAESIRFFYASHLDRKVVDVDLNFTELQSVTNNVLVGNLGNFCYRTLTFANKNYESITPKKEPELEAEITSLLNQTKKFYESQDFKNAVKTILKIGDIGNTYFQSNEPWKDKEKKQDVVGFCVNIARNLSIALQPILPEFSKKVQASLGEPLIWNDLSFTWEGQVKPPEKLVEKIEKIPENNTFPLHLQAGIIEEVKDHPNADSLYVLRVNIGKPKQVVAGLKKYLSKDDLLNKKAIFCTNLKPAKLRGELSEAMVLVAEDDETISLLNTEAEPGSEAEFGNLKNSTEETTYDEFKKIKMVTKNNTVTYNSETLVCNNKEVTVSGVKEGSQIF